MSLCGLVQIILIGRCMVCIIRGSIGPLSSRSSLNVAQLVQCSEISTYPMGLSAFMPYSCIRISNVTIQISAVFFTRGNCIFYNPSLSTLYLLT